MGGWACGCSSPPTMPSAEMSSFLRRGVQDSAGLRQLMDAVKKSPHVKAAVAVIQSGGVATIDDRIQDLVQIKAFSDLKATMQVNSFAPWALSSISAAAGADRKRSETEQRREADSKELDARCRTLTSRWMRTLTGAFCRGRRIRGTTRATGGNHLRHRSHPGEKPEGELRPRGLPLRSLHATGGGRSEHTEQRGAVVSAANLLDRGRLPHRAVPGGRGNGLRGFRQVAARRGHGGEPTAPSPSRHG